MPKYNWTREQLIIALWLYWRIPYNKISGSSNILIKETATIINRTPAALAYKLMNFTSLDAEKQIVGSVGKSSVSSAHKEIWHEYFGNWENLALDSTEILSKLTNQPIESFLDLESALSYSEGKEKDRIIKSRVNQIDFRQRILASYNEKCCITGIGIPSLLVASHIVP